MPYTSWPVTLAEAKTHLNITSTVNDGELQGFIDAATEVIETYVGTVATGTTQTDTFVTDSTNLWPYHYGTWPRYTYGTRTIDLRHGPVQAVTSVSVSSMDGANAVTMDASSYRLDPVLGTVTVIDGSAFGPLVTVTYTAGRATVPATVRLAALILIQHLWETQRAGSELPSAPSPDFDETANPGFSNSGFIIPNRVHELLTPYLLPPVVA